MPPVQSKMQSFPVTICFLDENPEKVHLTSQKSKKVHLKFHRFFRLLLVQMACRCVMIKHLDWVMRCWVELNFISNSSSVASSNGQVPVDRCKSVVFSQHCHNRCIVQDDNHFCTEITLSVIYTFVVHNSTTQP